MSNRDRNDVNVFWKLLVWIRQFGAISTVLIAKTAFYCVLVCSVLSVLGYQEDLRAQKSTQGILGSNPENASESDEISNKVQQNNSRTLLREGTIVRDQHVVIRVSGGRVMMTVPENSRRFYCLENLNLERISKVIQNNPMMTDWNVEYLVTEYQGSNYVLIQRAVLTSHALQTIYMPRQQSKQVAKKLTGK